MQAVVDEFEPEIAAQRDAADGDAVHDHVDRQSHMDDAAPVQRPENVGGQHAEIGEDHVAQLPDLVLGADVAVETQQDR